jgi:hypothetical protein
MAANPADFGWITVEMSHLMIVNTSGFGRDLKGVTPTLRCGYRGETRRAKRKLVKRSNKL